MVYTLGSSFFMQHLWDLFVLLQVLVVPLSLLLLLSDIPLNEYTTTIFSFNF